MPTGSLQIIGQVAGVSFNGKIDRTNTGGLPIEKTLPAAVAGLLTRSDANTGVVTAAGHGLTTADKCDVFWTGGCRYGMDATVAGDNVTVDLGAGDELPAAAATPVTIAEQVIVDNADFDADLLTQFAVAAENPPARIHIQFQEADLVEAAARDIPSGEPWFWAALSGVANPMATKHVIQAVATNASLVATTLKIGALYTA